MQTALSIIAHALRMLIFETGTTLRVLMPALLMILGSALLAATLAPEAIILFQTGLDPSGVEQVQNIALLLAFGLLGVLGYALMAILWHRHVLLSEDERSRSLFPDSQIFFRYLGRAILVGFMQILAGIPITLAMALMGTFLIPLGGAFATLLIGVLGGLAFLWVALRLSVVLPAAAMGDYMHLRESWETTAPFNSEIWNIAILLAGLNMAVFVFTGLILPETGTVALIGQTIVYILEGLVFISVLTTLYGHLVQGRSLG